MYGRWREASIPGEMERLEIREESGGKESDNER